MSHDVPCRLDHVGIAVPDIETAEPFLEALGATQYVVADGANGEIRWAGYRLGDASRLELIEPLHDESFLSTYLDEYGPGLHHVTVEVADLAAIVAALEEEGVRVVDVADHPDHGYSEAFLSPRNPTGALFQLMEYHDGYADEYGGEHAFAGESRVGQQTPRVGSDVVVDGDLPDERVGHIAGDAFCETLGIDLVALEPGAATTEVTVGQRHLNFHGTPHGGLVYTLADAAFAAASNSHDADAVALETNISYLDAVDVGDRLRATATESHLGGRTAMYDVAVEDGDGEPVASFRGRVYRFVDG